MRYRARPRVVAAARWASNVPYGDMARVEWEGFCLLHRIVTRSSSPRRHVRRSARKPVPEGWREISEQFDRPWVVIDERDGAPLIRQLSDDNFTAEFEQTEASPDDRRAALLAWARDAFHTFSYSADYLQANSQDRDRAPWTDPILRAERDRVTALLIESGLPYPETFDPEQPDRTLHAPHDPARLRVTADLAEVLQVLLEHSAEPILGKDVRDRSELGGRTAGALLRLQDARWVAVHRDGPPGPAEDHRWSLTEAGARLARQRLERRGKAPH
jgi:hypothetical protein